MTEFDVLIVQGGPETYRPGIVGQLDFDVQPGEIVGLADADGAGRPAAVERVQGPRRALDLFATPRARDSTRLEQFGLGERCRWGFFSLSGWEPQRLFDVLALLARPERTS
jgi:ABC-type lipopolysaccharide export system ATPase subunit